MTMLRIALLATAATLSTLAFAQQMDPTMPMPGMEAPSKTQPVRRPASSSSAPVRSGAHAGHDMGSMGSMGSMGGAAPATARPPQGMRTKRAKPSSADSPAGHDMAGAAGMGGMAGMAGMAGMGGPPREMPNAPPPAAALSGPAHAADLVFGPSEMAQAREELRAEQGDLKAYRILGDRLETRFQKGRDGYRWDVQGWYGGDIDKLWIKSEGSGVYDGKLERGEIQALWSRAISPWFDLQMGARQDFAPNPQRTHAVLGVQGLMPYSYNVEAALFLSNKGEFTARFNADYDFLITQRLILQPRAEVDLSAQNIPELGIGAGLSTIEVGLRLRYEFIPEFAPYVGVEYERKVGSTGGYARARGQDVGSFRYLAGLRSWF